MKVKKLGHCCLLIEEAGTTILTDPGNYSTKQSSAKNVDLILITHEHADHIHLESLKEVIKNNPDVKIITNSSVGKLLEPENIEFQVVADGDSTDFQGVKVEGIGTEHAYIYSTMTSVENTGYFIANKLFYPGDAFTVPGKEVDVLALPVAGPWMHISEALDYAKQVKPKSCFPVHDGMLQKDRRGPERFLPKSVLEPLGIKFVALDEGDEANF